MGAENNRIIMKPDIIKRLLTSHIEDDVLLGIEYCKHSPLDILLKIIDQEHNIGSFTSPHRAYRYRSKQYEIYISLKDMFLIEFPNYVLFYHSNCILMSEDKQIIGYLLANGYKQEFLNSKINQ